MIDNVLQYLDSIGVHYTLLRHEPVVTAMQSSAIVHVEHCIGCKSLYVKDKKSDHWYMVVLPFAMRADMRGLASVVGCAKFEFATEDRLMQDMGVCRGSVSPYAYLNNRDIVNDVPLIMDSSIMDSPLVKFHPCDNSATVVTTTQDFVQYAKSLGINIILA